MLFAQVFIIFTFSIHNFISLTSSASIITRDPLVENDLMPPSCDSKIYCQGDLLRVVQMARIFKDSKTFVDMRMNTNENLTLASFGRMMKRTHNNPSVNDVATFVKLNFKDGNEITPVTPPDWHESPAFVSRITNSSYRAWVSDLNVLWKNFTRHIKQEVYANAHRYSIETIPNSFVVPGGRFKEIYYWDSYWIINGLLLCEMKDTARGMIENMFWLIDKHGFIPNGGRVYYAQRSHPPLLSHMMRSYIDSTNDIKWLRQNVKYLETELNFWLNKHTTNVNGYTLARYFAPSSGPRPESYREDYELVGSDESELYVDLKSGAESGWDFSNRWVIDKNGDNTGNLSQISTRNIIPVDLNAFLCGAFKNLAYFYKLLNEEEASQKWSDRAEQLTEAIANVLYDEIYGAWFDYDIKNNKPRKMFYITNVYPLWSKCVPGEKNLTHYGHRAAVYLAGTGAMNYPGGVPNSLDNSTQQWDYPNAWAPLQRILAESLVNTGSNFALEVAKNVSLKWVEANYIGYTKTQKMFEKYNVEKPGDNGGGGEYESQTGFGWTNGVVMQMLNDYGTD